MCQLYFDFLKIQKKKEKARRGGREGGRKQERKEGKKEEKKKENFITWFEYQSDLLSFLKEVNERIKKYIIDIEMIIILLAWLLSQLSLLAICISQWL